MKHNIQTLTNLKREGKKIGFTCSTFELGPHVGHLYMLAELKSLCDYAVVGLLVNPSIDRSNKNKPVQSTFERWCQISSCEYVDMVIPFESENDLQNMLVVLMPDIRLVGDEYKNKPHTGKDIPGITIHYHRLISPYSSSALRERVYTAEHTKRENPI